METKEEIIKKYGKNDGHDEARWKGAVQMAGEIDKSPSICFPRLVKLEDDGIIELNPNRGANPDMSPPVANGTLMHDLESNSLKFLLDGITHEYPTMEAFKELVDLIYEKTSPREVQPLAQDAFSNFTKEWTAGKYKDKGINMESVFMMGYQLGWAKKEDDLVMNFSGEEITTENFSERVKEGLGQCLNGENTSTEMELVDGVAQEVSSGQ